MRISFSVPDEVARLLETKSRRAGYPNGRVFMRALTIWIAAKMAAPDEDTSDYAEEVRAMFAELAESEAPVYGITPKRGHKRSCEI